MYCTNCGKPLEDGVSFCPYCGRAVDGGSGTAASAAYRQELRPEQPPQKASGEAGQPAENGQGGNPQPGSGQPPRWPQEGTGTYYYRPLPDYGKWNSYEEKQSNGIALAGFICSFFIPLLGWIFGGIGLARSGERNGKGRGFSIAALVIATVMVFFYW